MHGYDPNLSSRYIGLSKKSYQALSILVIPIHEKIASGPWTTCVHAGKRQDIPCNRAVHPPIRSRGLDSVQTTGEKAACFHDATSALDHEDNLDGQSDKQRNT